MLDIQQFLQGSLQPHLSPESSSLALGITFGIKGLLDEQIANDVKIIGVTHMMVLSGTNISMFMNFTSSILFFIPPKTREVLSIVAVLVFLSLIPLQPSILRAALMSIIPRVGGFFGKQTHPMYLLFLTCSLILCFDIHILYDISFQLSFLAVFGILLFYKRDETEEQNPNIVRNVLRTIKDQSLLGFSAQVFTAPLIFYYFGNISLISPVANIVLAPLISPIMTGTMLLTIATKTVLPIANIIGMILNVLLYCMVFSIRLLAQARFLFIQY